MTDSTVIAALIAQLRADDAAMTQGEWYPGAQWGRPDDKRDIVARDRGTVAWLLSGPDVEGLARLRNSLRTVTDALESLGGRVKDLEAALDAACQLADQGLSEMVRDHPETIRARARVDELRAKVES